MKSFQLNGEAICGKYYAINNICTREAGPLADGGRKRSRCASLDSQLFCTMLYFWNAGLIRCSWTAGKKTKEI